MKQSEHDLMRLFKTLTDVSISLSTEKNHERLLEIILMKAKEITHADGGTIYTATEDKKLKFEIMLTTSLGIHLGGTSDKPITLDDLPLYDENGNPNNKMLAPWAALSKQTINIKNVYTNKKFDLSGPKAFDKKTGFHSKSLLTVPMTNHLNEVIGVLQLINPIDKKTKEILPFSQFNEYVVESLASQAAVIMTNRELITAQKKLFDSLIQLIAKAIDEKSPYTGGHCRRVPVIARMIADAACRVKKGALKDFTMTDEEIYELEVAAWLHDCGKITTPEAVVDKATKLEGIYDGIDLVDARFEILKRDAIIEALKQQMGKTVNTSINDKLQKTLSDLDKERDLIRISNIGGEAIADSTINAINTIAQRTWSPAPGEHKNLLSEAEVQKLEIYRGTLSDKERAIINNHVSVSIKMLESLPYPKGLKNVPLLAGAHHEKMNGTGYPRGLTKDDMPLQARMIAIADVFEALTASDRPYKKSMPIAQALSILGKMKLDGHIDPDLFDVFMHEKIYEQYAKEHLKDMPTSEIDVTKIPGYQAL